MYRYHLRSINIWQNATIRRKIHNSSLNTTRSARNLGFIFDEHLTFSDQISAVSKGCYYHIRQLRCIRPYLDSTTACTIATSISHSKLDYCNSLYYNLPKSQITRLQLIQNSLARAVVKAPKSCHITPVLRSLHWLKINERIEYKLDPFTHLQSPHNQPTSTSPPPHLCSTSSQYSLFISGYLRSPTNIILLTHNRSLLSLRLALSLESTSQFSPSTSFQPLCLCPSCSCSYHFFSSCQLTTLTIHNSISLSLPAQDLPLPQIFPPP